MCLCSLSVPVHVRSCVCVCVRVCQQVRGYVGLLAEKRKEVGDKAAKLKGGLTKLDETAVQVGLKAVLGTCMHTDHWEHARAR